MQLFLHALGVILPFAILGLLLGLLLGWVLWRHSRQRLREVNQECERLHGEQKRKQSAFTKLLQENPGVDA